MTTIYAHSGLQNAYELLDIWNGNSNQNITLTKCPCFKSDVYLASRQELNRADVTKFLRELIDKDTKLSNYFRNRVHETVENKTWTFIGNYLQHFPEILGCIVFPSERNRVA